MIKGVTEIVATTAVLDVLAGTKELMVPEPAAASPIEVVLFVQLYTVLGPEPGEVKTILEVGEIPAQTS